MHNKNNIANIITEEKCTGCSACMNICPINAISMKENRDTFIMPMVNEDICVACGKCVAVCPSFHTHNENKKIPECYAFRADDEIRMKSSSGGLFSVLSSKFIDYGGYVCGAAFDNDFNLKHVIAENWSELLPMRGSKYIQSHLEFVYRAVKKILDNNKKMLFTGTPCQIAALNSYLGKKYENLFTIDLMCHGVPSQKLFKIHLKEIYENKKIAKINFRDKRYGWTSLILRLEFADGTVYEGNHETDAYEKGFRKNLILRKSCANCSFCDFPRQGDITIGDFWGYEIFHPQYADSQGTSLVFINNEKGKGIFDSLSEEKYFIKKVDCDIFKIKNRTVAKTTLHISRERCFALLKNKSFSKAINDSINEHFDIGCVGVYSIPNYGGALTYYALYNVLEDMGYSTLMIERPKSGKMNNKYYDILYEKSSYPRYARSQIFNDKKEMSILNKKCDIFMVGSDQLFNEYLYNKFDKFVSLDWVQDNKKKIAYAASFGHDHIWSPEETRAEMSFFMRKFDAFSVREETGVRICKDEFGIDAAHVLDPVFICSKKHYQFLASLSLHKNSPDDKFINCYILDHDEEKQNLIDDISKEIQLPYRLYKEIIIDINNNPNLKNGMINKWLVDFIDANFIITDSFHGVCFAIIFHKNFIAYANKLRGYARFQSILGALGITERLIYSYHEFHERKNELLKPVDFKSVDEKLELLKYESLKWLRNNLERKIVKGFSDYDIYKNILSDIEEKFYSIILDNKKRIMRLINMMDNEFVIENNIINYLSKLESEKNNLIIIVTVKDTPGYAIDNNIASKIQRLGTHICLHNKHWKSYIAVIYRGVLIHEEISKNFETLKYEIVIDRFSIMLASSSYRTENLAEIKINGYDMAINKRGLNLVIIDMKTNRIIDSVCFDTHLPSLIAYR